MAKNNKSRRQAVPKKETVIPKSYLEQKAEEVMTRLQISVDKAKESAHQPQTGKLLQDIVDEMSESIQNVLDTVDSEGIQYREDQGEFCEQINAIEKKVKHKISNHIKAKRGKDVGEKKYMRIEIRDVLSEARDEVKGKYLLPAREVKKEKLETKEEVLNYLILQFGTILAQNGLNSMIATINKKSTENNLAYFTQVGDIFYPFLLSINEALTEALMQIKANFDTGEFKSETWDANTIMSVLEESLMRRKDLPRHTLRHELLSDNVSVQLHKRIKHIYDDISRNLSHLHNNRKFRKVQTEESDHLAMEIFTEGLGNDIPVYTRLRDANIEANGGTYKSVVGFVQLRPEFKDIIKTEISEFLDPATGLFEIPDDKLTLELICDSINDLDSVDAKFLLPEDIIRIFTEHNEVVEENEQTTLNDEKVLLKRLFKNKFSKHIETIILRFVRNIKATILQSKSVVGGKFIPIGKSEFAAAMEILEAFKQEVYGQFDGFVNEYFEKNGDEWEAKNIEEIEHSITQPLIQKLDEFCAKFEKFGVEVSKEFLIQIIVGTKPSFQEVVDDLNNEVEPDNERSEPNVEDLVLKVFLYGQAPKGKEGEKWLIQKEFDVTEMKLVTDYLDLLCSPETLKQTDIEELLSEFEDKGLLKDLVDNVNDSYYCGQDIRGFAMIRDIAFEYLTKKKREYREAIKVEVELPSQLKDRLDRVIVWVQTLSIPFSEEKSTKKSSPYIKEAWAHNKHLEHRKNMPTDIIEKHIQDLEDLMKVQKPDGGFSAHFYNSKKQGTTEEDYWLRKTSHPYKKEDQRTSPTMDRLDAHLAIFKTRKIEIEAEIAELEDIRSRIGKLKGDVTDLNAQIEDCDKAINTIKGVVANIRSKMAEMIKHEPMEAIMEKGQEAEKEDLKKNPIISSREKAEARIQDTEKKITDLESQIAELPKLEQELQEIEDKLSEAEKQLKKICDLFNN